MSNWLAGGVSGLFVGAGLSQIGPAPMWIVVLLAFAAGLGFVVSWVRA